MTDIEKQIMTRLCAKLLQYAGLGEDKEVDNLIDWVIINHNIKEQNNQIRDMMKLYKGLMEQNRNGMDHVGEQIESICRKRDGLYHEQQELKHKRYLIEQELR